MPLTESAKHISANCHLLRAFRGNVHFLSCGELMGHTLVSCLLCSERGLLCVSFCVTSWRLVKVGRLLCVSPRQTVYQGIRPAHFHSYPVTTCYNFPSTQLLTTASQGKRTSAGGTDSSQRPPGPRWSFSHEGLLQCPSGLQRH